MPRISLAFLIFALATPAFAEPRIENLTAVAAGGKVSVQFTLADAFNDGEMVQALQSGLPTSFTYEAEIFRDRPNWFDESIDRLRIEVICTFNSVTREYLLNYRRDRKLVRSETFSELHQLQTAMTNISEPDLFDITGRSRPYKMKVRVRADLMRSWRFYVIPWEVTTRWREARVKCPECQGGSSQLRSPRCARRHDGCEAEATSRCGSSARSVGEADDAAPPATRRADGRCGPISAALVVNDVPHRLLLAQRISARKGDQRGDRNCEEPPS